MISTKKRRFGISDFLILVDLNGCAKWSVIAVKAPLELVVQQFLKIWKEWGQEREVLVDVVKQVVPDDELDDSLWQEWLPIVQLSDSPWTIIYRSLGECCPGEGKLLSEQLQTSTINFYGEDVSDALVYESFTKGELEESGQFYKYGDIFSFDSQKHSQPKLAFLEEDIYPEQEEGELIVEPSHNQKLLHGFLDELFAQQEVYIPVCFPINNDKFCIAVCERSADTSGRADLIRWQSGI